jgi:hypothetical protein
MRKGRLGRIGDTIEEAPFVERAVRATLTARAVVGHQDDERVLELSRGFEVVEHATELIVGVRHETREHFGHARKEASLVGAQRVPRTHGVEHRPGLTIGARALGFAVRIDR